MKKKHKSIFIVILLLVILIILIVILLNLIKLDREKDIQGQLVSEYVQDKIIPLGAFKLNQIYDGKINDSELYKNLNEFEIFISKLIKKINKNSFKIDECYDKNEFEVKKFFISDIEFQKFVEYLKEQEYSLNDFVSAKIYLDSFENRALYLKFKMCFIYENEQILEFNVHYMKNKSNSLVARYYTFE